MKLFNPYILILIWIAFACSPKPKDETNFESSATLLSNVEAFYAQHEPSDIEIPYETEEEFLQRIQWWKDAKYGMFIHWGLYAVLGGEYNGEITPKIAEWIQHTLKIPLSEYRKLVDQFNPENFDADAWATVAKEAGMKYVVLTSKHHDGFALFDSKVSDYDIMSTPYSKDIVKKLKEACQKQGLKFGLYYSHTIDWEHPDAYIGEGKLGERMNSLDYTYENNNRTPYLQEKSYPQLREILTNYGTIDILWFDMGGGLNNDEIREFVKITRQLQPNIIISSRLGDDPDLKILDRGMLFDFYTPSDNYFTGDDLNMPWEMCGTTNGSWGFRKDDQEWRDAALILNSLIATASRNGNYLLNVGPEGSGLIPAEPIKQLKIAGDWLKQYGEAVYETTGSPFPWSYDWGYITQKPNKLYLNIFNWPKDGTLTLNGLLSNVENIYVLGSDKKVKFNQESRYVSIDLTGVDKNELVTALVVHYKDETVRIDRNIAQSADNNIRLDRICGSYEKDLHMTSWIFKVNTTGTYKIQVISNEKARHSNPQWVGSKQKGSIQVAGKIIPLELKRDHEEINPSLFFYKEITSNAGEITFDKPGTYSLQLKGFEVDAGKWKDGLGLSRVTLTPSEN